MYNTKSITATIRDVHVKIHMFAKRADIYYGVGLSPRNYVFLVEMVKTTSGELVVNEIKQISFNEINSPACDKNIECSVRCFISNAYLKDQFPDLQNKVCTKIKELISEIPQPEVFDF